MTGNELEVHPLPPGDFSETELPSISFDGAVWRISKSKYSSSLHFGSKVRNRFDDPGGEFGVCYCSVDQYGAFVETFGHAAGFNLVTHKALNQRKLVEISVTRALHIVDITGPNLKKIGADGRIIMGGDYSLSRAWALAIHNHPDKVDGIYYRSRNDPERLSIAIFHRAADALEIASELEMGDVAARQILAPIIEHYGFGLA